MKIIEFIQSLDNKNLNKRPINDLYVKDANSYNTNNLKIIGITGSNGKSTVAYIIHKYLQFIGKKSVLYSSIMVDSPASLIPNDQAYEIPCKDESSLLSILNETLCYGSEYLVLEVNESTIEKGILNDLDFDVKILTNLFPSHDLDNYTENEYINIKKSFFQNINEECKCVYCFQNYNKELLNDLVNINNNDNIICTNQYICNKYQIDVNNIDFLIYEASSGINGQSFKVRTKNNDLVINTNLLMFYNAMNILTSISCLSVLDLYDNNKFSSFISNINVPGRVETYYTNGRTIIIDGRLQKVLENLSLYKENNDINNIKVIVGSIGSFFITWDKKYKTENFIEKHHVSRRYAVDLLNQYCDYVCFTENDNAKENALDICLELKSYLNENIKSEIIVDRKEAIKKVIINSNIGDVIFIPGRGNRKLLCVSENKVKHFKDSDIVIETLNELGWNYNEK